jgi:competence protein ComEA
MGEWIEKNRLYVGLGLIVLILISSGVLAWKLQSKGDQGELGEAKGKISELENRISQLEEKSGGQSSVLSSQEPTAGNNTQAPANQVTPAQSSDTQGKVAGAVSGLININTASASELDALPGIGPVYAQRIIDYRNANGPFASIDAVQNVKGIGAKTFAKFKDKITVN